MNETVTATYTSIDQARNAKDELLAVGIPSEQVYIDESANKIRVMVALDTRPGIVELLEKHGLAPARAQPQATAGG